MDFAGLHAWPHILHGDPVTVEIAGKGVARLMGDDLHISLGPVEIGKYKGDVVIGDGGAVASAGLPLGGKDVHQFVFQHGAKELTGLRRKLIVKLLSLGQDVVRRADRARVAAAEVQRGVREGQRVSLAQALRLLAHDRVGDGHQVFPHGGAELLDILLGPAVALHAVIAQLRIAAVAELSAHLIAQTRQLVVDAVKLGLVVLEPPALGLPRRETARVVRIGLEGLELRERIDPTLEGDLRRGDQLAVLGGQLVFLLHVLDDLRREGLPLDLGVAQQQIAVFRLKIRAEGRGEHRVDPGLLVLLHLGADLVPELDLAVVELVAGVDRMAHIGQRRRGVHSFFALFLFQEGRAGLGVARRVFEPLGPVAERLLHDLGIGSAVRHF